MVCKKYLVLSFDFRVRSHMRIMSAIAKSRFDRMACVKARCDLEGILVSMSTKIALSRVDRMGPAVHAITRDSLTCLGVCGS